jgi:hypothetical protein
LLGRAPTPIESFARRFAPVFDAGGA